MTVPTILKIIETNKNQKQKTKPTKGERSRKLFISIKQG
jgi:hypothetical protein